MKIAGYLRVSTEGQVDAFGKEVQRSSIQTWADLNGHTVTEWFEEDAVSGTIDGGDRPVLRGILDRASEFDGIVAFDATRIARRLIVQETLFGLVWASGLRVFTSTAGEVEQNEDDPTKILIRQILGVIAEFDHRTTVRKLTNGRLAKSAAGGYIGGGTRFGVSVEGSGKSARFVANAVESRVIQEAVRLQAVGYSLRMIATSLNNRQIPTKMGKQWSATQVHRILKRYNMKGLVAASK